MLPLYFPRSQSEEDFTAYHLPYDIGNEDGEPVIPERQIRIQSKPSANNHSRLMFFYPKAFKGCAGEFPDGQVSSGKKLAWAISNREVQDVETW